MLRGDGVSDCRFLSVPDRRLHVLSILLLFLLVTPVLTLKAPQTKIAEFANSVDPNEVAHYEPPHLNLHCLPSSP